MKTLNILAAGSILAASTIGANAATLTGDDVTLSIAALGLSQTATVGAGVDFTVGVVRFDLDAGADGDELIVSVTGDFINLGAPSIEFSSLDFSGGELLTGFSDLSSQFANTSFSITSDSIRFSFDDGGVSAGTLLSGKFVTSPVAPAIPLPAGAWLLLTALGGLAAAKRRKTRSA